MARGRARPAGVCESDSWLDEHTMSVHLGSVPVSRLANSTTKPER
jgi:hypothetical protein